MYIMSQNSDKAYNWFKKRRKKMSYGNIDVPTCMLSHII